MELSRESEVTSERLNNTSDFLDDVIKRSKDWKVSYCIAPVTESYAGGDIELHLHLFLHLDSRASIFEIKSGDGKAKGIHPSNPCIRAYPYPSLDFRASPEQSSNLVTAHRSEQNLDEAMFVGVIQLLKKKKGALPTPIPFLVWLKSLNACPISPMDALQISQAVSPMPELRNDVILPITPISMTDKMNWEGSPGIRVDRIQQGKLPSQEVECGTQVVSHFADYDAPLLGKFRRASLYYNGIVSSLFIEFGSSNDTGILPEESFRIFLQGYELGFCPLDLTSCAIEWMHTLFYNTLAHVYSLYTMNFIMLVSLIKYQYQGVRQMTDNHIVTAKWVDAKFCSGIHREDNILEHNMSEFESLGYLISKPKLTTIIAAERNNVAGDRSSSLGSPLFYATLGCH